ncbi:lanthionine synthetase LanC family protein [Actinophytocola oryzae]|uniref:Lanthionine synthetase-like protein n=1 Tax=Actinophytocola oryzae TaxID=502181 RepID=A0A4R7VXM6_9PSEU|nr:lanthionine synthetase LanC family protein [Actinophytocola oryzae]TDV54890.1 lanthionine synthetase-like protein [Actinophytocola oryzae]
MSASHHVNSTQHRDTAEAAWRWVLAQIRWNDGPSIPESVPGPELDPAYRNGFHMGVGGLAYVLAEIAHCREWTVEETDLANAIADQLTTGTPDETSYTFFDGLVSTIGVLTALDAPGTRAAVLRLNQLATPTGWVQSDFEPADLLPDARFNDVTLGTAGVLLAAVWAHRNGVSEARELAESAAAVLVDEMETLPTGVNWPFVPERYLTRARRDMPNFSHGLSGIASALAVAGAELGRPDLTALATRGAEHLVTLGTLDGAGFAVPHYVPRDDIDADEFTHNWCHGGAGTSLLFSALHRAGVAEVAGDAPLTWHRRCLHGVRASGLPARRYPGFWDNDGRCCGTAGVADIFLSSWQRSGDPDDLAFALLLADTLVERAVVSGPHAYWRFTEHRDAEPLLPPGVGWGQGAAGIAAYLFRVSRLDRDAAVVARMDSWWTTDR